MKYFFIPFLIFFISVLSAQVGERYTEEDINIQAQIVKASQKKLLRKYDDAIKIYESILEKDRNNSVALFDLSRIYLAQEKEEKAIEYGEKALKKEPQNSWYKESLAEIKMNFKHYDEAAELFQQLASQTKTNQNLYLNAVESYRKAGNELGTLKVFEKMEEVFGKDSYTSQQIIGIYLNQENYNAAINKAKELSDLFNDDPEYLQLYAELEADFGSKDKAEILFKKLIQRDPDNSKALVFLAQKSGGNDQLDMVRNVVTNPKVDIDAKVKALIPYAEKITAESVDKESVISFATEIVKQHPEEAKGYALLGDLLNNSGQPEEAEKQYMSALKYDKSVYAVWEQLMFIQYDLGHYQELAQTSNNALDFYPNQAAPYAFLGLARANMGDFGEAKSMMNEAQLISTNNEFVKSIISLLARTIEVQEDGDEIKVMSREDLFMRGINSDDPSVIQVRSDGKYLVRVKKGS